MMCSGKFITLEGVDGSGKTIQVQKLSKFLTSKGIEHICVREPGGTDIGEKIRNIILLNNNLDPITEALLFFSVRNELLKKIVIPALQIGKWIICDRFYDSTLVYQGIIKGMDIEDIMKLKFMTMGHLEPDLTIIFDVNAKIAQSRISKRQGGVDKYEQVDGDVFEKIIQGYKKISETFPFRCHLVNAKKNEDDIFEELKNLFIKTFKISV